MLDLCCISFLCPLWHWSVYFGQWCSLPCRSSNNQFSANIQQLWLQHKNVQERSESSSCWNRPLITALENISRHTVKSVSFLFSWSWRCWKQWKQYWHIMRVDCEAAGGARVDKHGWQRPEGSWSVAKESRIPPQRFSTRSSRDYLAAAENNHNPAVNTLILLELIRLWLWFVNSRHTFNFIPGNIRIAVLLTDLLTFPRSSIFPRMTSHIFDNFTVNYMCS